MLPRVESGPSALRARSVGRELEAARRLIRAPKDITDEVLDTVVDRILRELERQDARTRGRPRSTRRHAVRTKEHVPASA